jgi:glucose dehydrogenase
MTQFSTVVGLLLFLPFLDRSSSKIVSAGYLVALSASAVGAAAAMGRPGQPERTPSQQRDNIYKQCDAASDVDVVVYGRANNLEDVGPAAAVNVGEKRGRPPTFKICFFQSSV